MSEQPELWTCSKCGARQDISQLGFYAEIECRNCGTHAFVHTMLANFKVESILGIGGMSVVFRARDIVLGRPLAIKVLNDTYRDEPERIAGFENECSLMAKVHHDNVVDVYSAGWARGQFYIAMELVDGRNLELIVSEKGSIEPDQTIEIIRQVALGLQAAHSVGILHRDVKPGNVLITEDDQAKVLDFGLSLDEKSAKEDDEIIWATPYYVPPETLRREESGVKSDIYSLGMMMRNLLTGETDLPNAPQTVADMLVSKKTLVPLKKLVPQLDDTLCELVDRMTAFEPEDRPENYDEVLELVTAAQQTLADNGNPEVLNRRWRRRLFIVAGAAASILVGLAGAFIVSRMTPSETIAETLNADQLNWVERDSYASAVAAIKAGDMTRAAEMLGMLTRAGADPTVAAPAILMRTALDVLNGKATANGYRRFAELETQTEGVAPLGRENFDKMVALVKALKSDISAAAQLAGEMKSSLLKVASYILVADSYVHKGDYGQAEQLVDKATELLSADDMASLRAHVAEYRSAGPRRAARAQLEEVKGMFRAGHFDAAVARIPGMKDLKLSRVEKEELRVMSEASSLMIAIHEMLKKHGRNVSPGMKPVDLRTAAAGLGTTEKLPKELYCIALLLYGDFDAAFRENPYAAEENSELPFAVMMRDWQLRLGR